MHLQAEFFSDMLHPVSEACSARGLADTIL
jgi:hypothetical protein